MESMDLDKNGRVELSEYVQFVMQLVRGAGMMHDRWCILSQTKDVGT